MQLINKNKEFYLKKINKINCSAFLRAVFFDPILEGANHLCILSADASPNMASWLIKSFEEVKIAKISFDLVIGSVADNGIDIFSHKCFVSLYRQSKHQKYCNFKCSYMHDRLDTYKNLYIWLKDDETPIKAFSCSSEFIQSHLREAKPDTFRPVSAISAYNRYSKILDKTIYSYHSEVEEYIPIKSSEQFLAASESDNADRCVLSFLTKTGKPGDKSGLNWGQRTKRNRNQAYIPVPRSVAVSGFFPVGKQHFLAITDDHHSLHLRLEQENDKALTTPLNNSLLGEYFRNRLGLANGAYVHLSDLENYGRTDVTFIKFDDEHYYMDFSVNKRVPS